MINENKGRVSKEKLSEITKKLGVNLDELIMSKLIVD